MSVAALELRHIKEFKESLNNYQPSNQIRSVLKKNKFVLLVAPTAAGRNTIIKDLTKSELYHYVISDTTRPPRHNNGIIEENGVEYWFKTEEEFLDDLKKGNYLEAAIIHGQQVSGINVSELNKASATNKVPITDIDIKGCDTIQAYSEHVVSIFVLPPKYSEWMERLDARGKMSKEEKKRRLKSAYHEINQALNATYFSYITNDDLQQTVAKINKHINNGNFKLSDQDEERAHARQLLEKLKDYL